MKRQKTGKKEETVMNKKYTYFNCELDESQYDDYDFNDSKIVEARDVKA